MLLDRLVRLLLPRQDRFFTLLESVADRMTQAAAVFGELATASGHQKFEDVAGRDNGGDAKELVRQKDMLFTLEDGIDRCEDAMDVIRSVVVKNG